MLAIEVIKEAVDTDYFNGFLRDIFCGSYLDANGDQHIDYETIIPYEDKLQNYQKMDVDLLCSRFRIFFSCARSIVVVLGKLQNRSEKNIILRIFSTIGRKTMKLLFCRLTFGLFAPSVLASRVKSHCFQYG